METITRQALKEIDADLREALKSVAEKHGLEVEIRGGSFDSESYRPKVEFKTATADEDMWNTWADLYGLSNVKFGDEFQSQGLTFRISGVSPRSSVRPVLATRVDDGRQYKFTEDSIRRIFAMRNITERVEAKPQTSEKTWSLVVDGEVLKTSKSKASLQSFRSKNKTGGDIV